MVNLLEIATMIGLAAMAGYALGLLKERRAGS